LLAGLDVALGWLAGGQAMNNGQKSLSQQVQMIVGFVRVNARAYAAVLGTVLRERLWRVSPRGARATGSAR
jgi:hypothetical protein